jgi:hypothetical protein
VKQSNSKTDRSRRPDIKSSRMAQDNFIKIGKHIFSKSDIVSIVEDDREVTVKGKVAIVTLRNRPDDPIELSLPEGKSLEDLVDFQSLNF